MPNIVIVIFVIIVSQISVSLFFQTAATRILDIPLIVTEQVQQKLAKGASLLKNSFVLADGYIRSV